MDHTAKLWDPLNNKGDTVASCDADRVVKLWDVRPVRDRSSIDASDYPINKISFDRSGKVLSAASDDGTIKMLNTDPSGEAGVITELRGH